MVKVKQSLARLVSFLIVILVVTNCFVVRTNASVVVPKTQVDLYFLNESDAKVIGSVPASYATSYTINPTGSSSGYTYKIISGSGTVQVSSDGVITPSKTKIYYVNLGTTVENYVEGTAVVRVYSKSDNTYADITVNTHSYTVIYADNQIKSIANSIKTNYSTDEDRIRAITKYVADNYDYSPSYSGSTSMMLYGGGDCWASTDFIIRLATACGYDAWSRNANKDAGAGSGHINALVMASDGTVYSCDAGYVGTKPRAYSCYKRDTLFSYTIKNGKAAIYQYDGKTVPANFEIPSTISGYEVGEISSSFIHSDNITSIKIPNTVTTIGDFAFTQCKNLKSINIPASVTNIGSGILADCPITSLTVDANNKNYVSSNNIIYTKDYKELVAAPSTGTVTIPNTVETIADYAFYYNSNIKSITIPSSVRTIGEGAFGNCSNLSSITVNEGVTTLGGFVFANNGVRNIALPSTVSNVSDTTFYGMFNASIALPVATAPVVTVDQNGGIMVANGSIKIYITESATGFDVAAWKSNNITYIRSTNPKADAMVTPTPAPSTPSGNGGTITPSNPTNPTNPTVPGGSTTTPTTPNTPAPETGLAGFIERLYNVALGRASEAQGKNWWINKVKFENYTGSDVANGFLVSDEFLGKQMSNDQFLEVLYKTFFDRASDAQGKAYWLNMMANGYSKQDVINGFCNSTEWANLCLTYGIPSGSSATPTIVIEPNEGTKAFVTRLYTTCLGRAPEQAGFEYWTYRLANMQERGSSAAYGFFTSPEFTGKGYDNATYVTLLYRTILGREPDQAGLNYWLGLMSNGMSRVDVLNGFAASNEWADICSSYGILK